MLDGPEMGGITRGVPQKLKEPTTQDRMVSRAHDAKVDATDKWVRGEMESKEHEAVHKRADKVIKSKGRL